MMMTMMRLHLPTTPSLFCPLWGSSTPFESHYETDFIRSRTHVCTYMSNRHLHSSLYDYNLFFCHCEYYELNIAILAQLVPMQRRCFVTSSAQNGILQKNVSRRSGLTDSVQFDCMFHNSLCV